MTSENRVFPGQADLPRELRLELSKLVLDRRTVNMTLNIKAGKILSFKVEEFFSVK